MPGVSASGRSSCENFFSLAEEGLDERERVLPPAGDLERRRLAPVVISEA